MANKNIRQNDKAIAEQHVASIGAFQVDLQSWVSNSACLKIDRLKGNRLQALPDVKNTPCRVSLPVFLRSVSQNGPNWPEAAYLGIVWNKA
ncbi:hypothetical protein [Sulfitobacter sp. M13]